MSTALDWRFLAACTPDSLDVFFGPWRERPSVREAREEQAKAICAGCPARSLCLEWALSNRIEYGVFGGLSEAERRPLAPAGPRMCGNGLHEMTPENTYTYPGNSAKACRACREARNHRRAPRRHDGKPCRTEGRAALWDS